MKHEAIRNLYSNVVTITEDKGVFIAVDKNNNEVSIDMDAVNIKAVELQTAHDNEQETKKNNKVSAYRKMEMTDDEILAIDPTLEEYL